MARSKRSAPRWRDDKEKEEGRSSGEANEEEEEEEEDEKGAEEAYGVSEDLGKHFISCLMMREQERKKLQTRLQKELSPVQQSDFEKLRKTVQEFLSNISEPLRKDGARALSVECSQVEIEACVASCQGRREYMEDTFATMRLGEDCRLYAVFDGHGGHVCASVCAKLFLPFLGEQLKKAEPNIDKGSVMIDSFEIFDRVLCDVAWNNGATATVAILSRNGELIVGNVGDSRCVLYTSKPKKVDELTRDHSAGLLDERERIKQLGGRVTKRPCGEYRVEGVLAVSRAFGDAALKPFVSPTPEVVRRTILPQGEAFLLIASDGVWDVVGNDEASELVKKRGPSTGCKQVVQLALDRFSEDNITCMVVNLLAAFDVGESEEADESSSSSSKKRQKTVHVTNGEGKETADAE